MKSTYFNALYLVALVLLAFLFYLSVSSPSEATADEISVQVGAYFISAWGMVIAALWLGMILMYVGVRRRFRSRFPRSRQKRERRQT